MKLVDIGANLTHASFHPDLAQVVARAREAGVARIVVTGTTVEDSQKALDLSTGSDFLFATAGVHPHHARDCGLQTIPGLRELARHAKVVAIGECGLCLLYTSPSPRDGLLSRMPSSA